ncbi:hypothetical protein F4861DRAFT_242698 [Xylaria intraflava]|nr:hypothetical protein F4861DRAFT_242698 [Xylaria intraflava]
MSSSGVPLIDTRLTHSASTTLETNVSPSFLLGCVVEDPSMGRENDTFMPYPFSNSNMPDTKPASLQQIRKATSSSTDPLERQLNSDSALEPQKRKGKEWKGRWLSNLKEWISISEPPTQALQDYRKADIAIDDPIANAKLYLPVASLPPTSIKPRAPGPEPDEVALQGAMQRKKPRDILASARTPRGSYSMENHGSPSSSFTMSVPRDSE